MGAGDQVTRENTKLKTIVCVPTFVFFFLLCFVGEGLSQTDEQKPTKDEFESLLLQTIKEGIRATLQLDEDLLIEDQEKFFELDQDGVAELKKLADMRLKMKMDQFLADNAKRALESHLANLDLANTFSVNGKEHTLKGFEPKPPFVTLRTMVKRGSVSLQIKSVFGTRTAHLYRIREIQDFRSRWIEVLENHSDRAYADYEKMIDDRFRENVVDMMLAIVTDTLAISPEQRAPLRKWLAGHAKLAQKTGIFEEAKSSLFQIDELPDDLLTESQQDGWQIMISELMLR